MKPDLPTKRRHKDLESSVNKINKSAAIKTSVVLKKLLKASKAKHNAKSTADVLLDVIDEIIGAKGLIRTMAAGEATAGTLAKLFNLKLQKGDRLGKFWTPKDASLKVPGDLVKNLRKVDLAEYDPDCKATCRIKIDIMLIECRLAFLKTTETSGMAAEPSACAPLLPMSNVFSLSIAQVNPGSSAAEGYSGSASDKHLPPAESSSSASGGGGFPALPPKLGSYSRAIDDVPGRSSSECTPGSAADVRQSTPPPACAFNPRQLTIYPELDVSVEITDSSSSGMWRVSGKADWALAYGNREDSYLGGVLIAVEAKKPSTFSSARDQLLTYLAIMHRLRLQNHRTNQHVQGFCSDGNQYRFLAITNDGVVFESGVLECRNRNHLKKIFNWIVSILVSSVKSSPSTSPTKPGQTQKDEIVDFADTVFVQRFKMDEGGENVYVDTDDSDVSADDQSFSDSE